MKLLKQILATMAVTLMFLVVPVCAEEPATEGEAYATFEESTGTLTFKRTAPGEAVPTAAEAGVTKVYTKFEKVRWYYESLPWYNERSKIIAVKSETTLHPITLSGWFYKCSNLTDISGLSQIDVTNSDSMYYTFFDCKNIKSLEPLEMWNTENTKDMFATFSGCNNLSDISSLENWNMSSVGSMSNMFKGCGKITNIGDLSRWNIEKVTNMSSIFDGCSAVTDIGSLRSWDTKNVKNMSAAFRGCNQITDLSSLSGWDTSQVTDMSSMFDGCSAVTDIGSLRSWDTKKTTNMSAIFRGCNQITDLSSLSGWNTDQVTNMSSMFDGCSSVTDISSLRDWDTKNVKDMSAVFKGCNQIADLSSLCGWDTSQVTTMSNMFNGCSNITDLNGLGDWNTGYVTNMRYMFNGCNKITDLHSLNEWNTSHVTDMANMFSNCRSITNIGLDNWATDNVYYMSSMFLNCSRITNLKGLENWKTVHLARIDRMFSDCSRLVNVTELANWDTSNVYDFSAVFAWCSSLQELDLSGWTVNFYSAWNGGGMFILTSNLKTVVLGEGFSFTCPDKPTYNHSQLSSPPNNNYYTGYWCKEGTPEGALPTETKYVQTSVGLAYAFDEDPKNMAGTWIWQRAPEHYIIKFDANGAAGSMADIQGSINEETVLPKSSFYRFDHEFTGWALSAKPGESDRIYKPGEAVKLSNKAAVTVTLYAQWQKNDNKATPKDGWYEFTLKGDEEAVFKGLPTESPYSVYEETPDGWVLVESSGEQGTVKPNEEAIAAFRNKKAPDSANVQLTASKLLNGKTPEGQTFQFELLEDGKVIQTVNSSADGTILFKQISYSKEGTHIYTIRETGLDTKVYESNPESFEVTVTVTKNAETGKLEASVAYPEGGVVFHNTTIVHKGSLLVSKTVEGSDAYDQDFTFQVHLSNSDGSAYAGVAEGHFGNTLTSLKDGDTFTLKAGQSVLFTIPDGVSYSVTEINIPDGFTVSQETYSGTITAGEKSVAAFTNTYQTRPVSVLLQAVKRLSGGDLSDEKYHFSFQLVDSDEKVVSTVTNTTDGSVLFDELTFETPGEYSYTIREVKGDLSGVDYDNAVHPVKVHVADPGNGQLTATVEYEKGTVPVFNNRIQPGSLSITKTVKSGTDYVKDREFTFTLSLKDKDENSLTDPYEWTSTTESRSGSITNGGTLTLKAGETITIEDLPAGTQYSFEETPVEGFEMTSSENTAGTIVGAQEAKASFENTYQIKEQPLELQLSKILTGTDLKDSQFTFQLKDESGNVIQEVKNKADGSIVFEPIAVPADSIGKTLKYTVTEVNDGQKFITYDEKTIKISVLVKDDGKGNMEFEITYPEEAVFKNKYEYAASGKLDLKAKKVLKDGTLKDGQFSFELVNAEGKVIQEVSNNAQGDIIFESVSYTLEHVGEHIYYLREKKDPKLDNVVYDETEYEIKVTVTDNKDGTLKVTAEKKVKGKDESVSELVFTNTWQEPVEMPSTGQPGIAQMTAAGLGIIAASALIIEERRKRRD